MEVLPQAQAQVSIIMRAQARWTYLEVAAGPVSDKVQLILQAAHISQVVKGSATDCASSINGLASHASSHIATNSILVNLACATIQECLVKTVQ